MTATPFQLRTSDPVFNFQHLMSTPRLRPSGNGATVEVIWLGATPHILDRGRQGVQRMYWPLSPDNTYFVKEDLHL